MNATTTFRTSTTAAVPMSIVVSAESAAVSGARSERLPAIDRLRGLVIVLMVLDHVRDFFSAQHFEPTDLTRTNAALFFTRWVSHLCAPCFIFLAGMSARLASERMTRPQLQRFLASRGLWLIALEVSVVAFVWQFNFEYRAGLVLQVIWAIGASMCVLAALVALPTWAIATFGLAVIVGHHVLDGIEPARFGAWAALWNVLHVSGPVAFGVVLYPLIPWIGVIAIGYAFGALYHAEPPSQASSTASWEPALGSPLLPFTPWIGVMAASHAFTETYRPAQQATTPVTPAGRSCWTLELGLLLCGVFIALRLLNGYGDPNPWSEQHSPLFTLLSFLNTSKYPPSLAYLLMTLGPALVLLAIFEHSAGPVARILQTFGRVPLFAYVLHLAIGHLLAGLTALALGHGTSVLRQLFLFFPDDWGFGLGVVYCAWIAVLALLYPLCQWFAALKQRRGDWWLGYL